MPRPWPTTPPTAAERDAYADARPRSFWLDALPESEATAPLIGDARAGLCIVGGGFTGLWTALHAKADDPSRDVMLLEGDRIGGAASGRNGGFCVASLTHGFENGLDRFPDEMETLERLGLENYAGLLADVARLGIDCDLQETGELIVALEEHQVGWLDAAYGVLRLFGHEAELLDGPAMQAAVRSPTYLGGLWDRTGAAILDPGKLVAGLRSAAEAAGVRIHEHTQVQGVAVDGGGVRLDTGRGQVVADRAVLATGAHPSPVRTVRRRIAPVYDYVLVTEPLSAAQLAAIGWHDRQGLSDSANQFHYYRRTADDRILWGGYDAVYRWRGPVDPRHDDHDASFARLSQHFFTTFPQLRGLGFSHRWGGAIDTCSRFSVFFGTTHRGRVSHAAGYTGLGVCASRFGARVALDLVDGRATEATALDYVAQRPMPFPPEPLRSAAIGLTRRGLEAADARAGRRGPWLRTLDRLGVGFDT